MEEKVNPTVEQYEFYTHIYLNQYWSSRSYLPLAMFNKISIYRLFRLYAFMLFNVALNIFFFVFCFIAASSVSVVAFPEFLLAIRLTISFPSHSLLSHITVVETVINVEKGTNPVSLDIVMSADKKQTWLIR